MASFIKEKIHSFYQWQDFRIGTIKFLKLSTETIPRKSQSTTFFSFKTSLKILCCMFDQSFLHHVGVISQFSGLIDERMSRNCELIYGARQFLPIDWLLLFYNAYARSFVFHGLLTYNFAAKIGFQGLEVCQSRVIKTNCSKKCLITWNTTVKHQLSTVFDLSILKRFHKTLKN